MKQALRPYIIFLILWSLSFTGSAQDLLFHLFTPREGLPNSEITAIGIDLNGFIWAGTPAGVSRYDGYNFKNYTHTSNNLPIGHVSIIRNSPDGILWIGSSAGLFRIKENQIHRYSIPTGHADAIFDILFENSGDMLLGTEFGPVRLSKQQLKKDSLSVRELVLPGWEQIMANKTLKMASQFAAAPDGSLFLHNQKDVFRIEHKKITPLFQNNSKEDRILSLIPVSKNVFLFYGSRSGINRINEGKKETYSFDFLNRKGPKSDPDKLVWLLSVPGVIGLDTTSMRAVYSINVMEKGLLWTTGFLRIGQVFWVSSHQGLARIKPSIFTRYPDPGYGYPLEIYSLFKNHKNQIIAGTNRGKTYEIKSDNTYPLTALPSPLVKYSEIKAIWQDATDAYWIGTGYEGLLYVSNGKINTYSTEDGLHNTTIHAILPASDNRIFAIGDHGLTRITGNEKKGFRLEGFSFPAVTSLYARCHAGIETPSGNILFGGEEGLWLLNGDSLKAISILDKKIIITDIIRRKNGNALIATAGNGILEYRFHKNDSLIFLRKISKEEGLSTSNILKLLIDKNRNLWVGHPKGLSMVEGYLDEKALRIRNFDQHDGFVPPGYYSMCLLEYRDTIWAGTSNGMVSFPLRSIGSAPNAPGIFISGIKNPKIRNAKRDLSENGEVNKAYAYNENDFEFSFTAIDINDQENMRYFYRLKGLDSQWTDAGEARNANYHQLKPGRYQFEVKALNSKGGWSKDTAAYSFEILPPFWKRGWFLITIALLLISGSYFLIRRRENKIREEEARKTEIEKLRSNTFKNQLETEQVINFFATAIQDEESEDVLLWTVAKNCISKLGMEDCVIYLVDTERKVLVQKAAWGPKTKEGNLIHEPIEIPIGSGIVGSVALSGNPELISDTSKDPRYIADDAIRFSELTVPMLANNRLIGVIDSEHTEEDFYTRHHLQIFQTIASLCAEKIEKIRAGEETKRKEREVVELKANLASSQLTTLRAQMNPHFIFNALNSVQQFILQGNAHEANHYLARFSRLQREILNNSDQTFISLEKEKEILEIYLQLEQLRFDENFSYSIRIDDSIDSEEFDIPPMIVQPFVENAIWHGLMPKSGPKHVDIQFSLADEQTLKCIITDNGIGRQASTRLQTRTKEHQSKGLQLVYERLHLLELQFNRPFEALIEDLVDSEKKAAGTRITLTLFAGSSTT